MDRRTVFILNLVILAAVVHASSALAITLSGSTGKTWDINDTGNGAVLWGTNYTFYNCYTLTVNGVQYNAGGASTPILGGRGVSMRQHYISSSLTVQRTAWVPSSGVHDYLRYYDTFENGSASAVDVTATYAGELDAWTSTVVAVTSSGDTVVDLFDTWYVCTDSYMSDTPNGHVWYDASALAPSSLTLSTYLPRTTFTFSVPPMSRVALMVFIVQMDTALMATASCDWLSDAPVGALEGLTTAEMMQILNWQAGGAPVIRLETSTLEVEEGATLDLTVTVQDLEGDSFDVAWDMDGDGVHDDSTATAVTFDASGMDGPASALVSVRAIDDESNERTLDVPIEVLNAAPVFTDEPAGLVDGVVIVSRGQSWEYQIVVEDPANADGTERDPVVVTVPERPEGSIFYGDMRLSWNVPNLESVVGDHPVSLLADDREGGETEQAFVIRVPANSPPGQPTIVSPDRTEVTVARPVMVIANAVDPDADPLIYQFQVSTSAGFESPSLVSAGNRVGNPSGQTSWTVTGDLEDQTRYYWRVWANDGRQDGPAASTYFDVDLSAASDPEPDTSTDADTGDVDFIPPGDGPGCGCTLVAGDAGRADPLLLFVGVLVALVRGMGRWRWIVKGSGR